MKKPNCLNDEGEGAGHLLEPGYSPIGFKCPQKVLPEDLMAPAVAHFYLPVSEVSWFGFRKGGGAEEGMERTQSRRPWLIKVSRRLWREISKDIHDDADRLFKLIGEAYAVISDPSKVDHNMIMKKKSRKQGKEVPPAHLNSSPSGGEVPEDSG